MALSAMALVTACTNDETIEMNQGDGITFNTVAGKLPVLEVKLLRQTVSRTSTCMPLHKDWSI